MKRLTNGWSGVVIALLFISFAATAQKKAPPKPDMFLTLEDGREVKLKPDSTWEFVQFSFLQEEFDDIYMDLVGNKIICLKNDFTWAFVKARPPKTKTAFKDLFDVTVTATATVKTLDGAVASARKQVFDRATARILPHAKKSKMTQQYLIACIKDEVGGEEGAEVSYKPGWTATARLELSKVQVNRILDCVLVQIEAQTGTDADTSKKSVAPAEK